VSDTVNNHATTRQ